MKLKSFIAFDVETATSELHSICQIGYCVVKNLEIKTLNSFLIQPPGNEYKTYNSNIHGQCSLDTELSPKFPVVWNDIKREFKSHMLVAHNASFDSNVLKSTLNFYNIKVPALQYYCTYKLTNLKLKSLGESLEIEHKEYHNAQNDAELLAKSFIKILSGHIPNTSLIEEEEPSSPFEFKGHERLSGDILKPNLNVENKDNPFYARKVVFTGVLKTLSRKEAAIILKDMGADIDTNISKRTHYVIMGPGAGPSKLKKIKNFNKKGSSIKIINEEVFLDMIK